MKTLQELYSEISKIVLEIENNYPELYKYLEENPMTLPESSKPKVDIKSLEEYKQSLTELLETYKKDH
ncbi:MAG TPA: hypothetical protein VKN14_09405 [Flavobacteriaceae bacterium]|nr:hypothetical protein [Flavobacteriaceae bacterium]